MVLALTLLAGACARGEPTSSDLPRATKQDITITMTESIEVLQLPGCNTYWWTRGEDPPPGACERATVVREFTATRGTGEVTTSVTGEVVRSAWFAMRMLSSNWTDGVSIMVVLPPSDTAIVRLVDSTGLVVDEVAPSDRLVAVAGLGRDLTVEAFSRDGVVIAECPPDGVVRDGVVYSCTPTSIPVTTTTFDDDPTP